MSIKVGIIGCGFVGGALKAWLEENNKDAKIFVSDPPKGYNDDLLGHRHCVLADSRADGR